MADEIKVPPVGESITEVVVAEWLKKAGESVTEDETIAILETDKVNMELPAPASGILSELMVSAGETATVGQTIALLKAGDAVSNAGEVSTQNPENEISKTNNTVQEPTEENEQQDISVSRFPRMSPSRRRALRAGEGDAFEESDMLATMVPSAVPNHRETESVPMTPLRKRIAERLVMSQQTGALLTTFNEVNLAQVKQIRREYQDQFTKKYGIKLGFMSFFVKAVIEGLKEFPALNAQIQDKEIVYHRYYDIGVAVGGGKGLLVPVIRNAERQSFAETELTIADFGKRARANQIKLDELQGGTFTISNGGIYGSMLSTPIVNPPQTGILGMHNIQERPVAENGQVVIRPMMYLALTYDHRLVDGREAVGFLVKLKNCLENPARMLIEV